MNVSAKEIIQRECKELTILRVDMVEARAMLADMEKKKINDKDTRKLLYTRVRAYEDCVMENFGHGDIEEAMAVVQGLKIYTKSRKLLPIVLNKGQRKMFEGFWRQAGLGLPLAEVLLKARQFGGSTFVELFQAILLRTWPERYHMVIAHNKQTSKWLFGMLKTAFSHDPLMGENVHTRLNDIYFDEGGGITVESGYKDDLMKGTTISGLHSSEVAYWRDPYEAFLSCLQAVPELPMCLTVMESTANGVGDFFHGLWSDGDDGYERIFVGWHEIEEYTKPFIIDGEKEDFPGMITDEEKQLQEIYSLTNEQLNWRRHTIRKKCRGNEESFRQEYPINPMEAFLSTGSNVFSISTQDMVLGWHETIKAAQKENKKEWKGNIYYKLKREGNPYEADVIRTRGGYMQVFERPLEGNAYGMGVDVAEGIDKDPEVDGEQSNRRDSDNSAITILNYGGRTTHSWSLPKLCGWGEEKLPAYEVLSWYGKCTPDELAVYVDFLAKKYNMANVGIEVKSYGTATMRKLVYDLKYPMNRIMKTQAYDAKGIRTIRRPGWITTPRTREFLIADLEEAIYTGSMYMFSAEFCKEMQTWINNKGKHQARSGYKDDKMIATAIAWQVVKPVTGMRPLGLTGNSMRGELSIVDQWKKIDSLKKGQSYNGFNVVS